MENENRREEKIDNYVHNLMTDVEKVAFEKEMQMDENLSSDVMNVIEFQKLFNIKEPQIWQQKIEQVLQKDMVLISKKRGKIFTFPMGIAASLLLFIAVGAVYLSLSKKDIVQVAKESSLDGLNRSSARKGDSIAVSDILFYSGKYSEYINKAKALLKENTDSMERTILNINICKSYIQLDQPRKAISFYESLGDKEKNCYLEYQVALALVVANDKNKAVSLFTSVVDKGCFPVDKKAIEWLEKLK